MIDSNSMMKIDKPWGYELILHKDGNKVVKLIHADQDLSVQVHPNKSESFTVLNRWRDDARIDVVENLFSESVVELVHGLSRDPQYYVNILYHYSKSVCLDVMESYFIKPKTLHYISGGQEVLEVSEGDPITLRAFDWGRNSAERPLDTIEIINLFNNDI